MTALLQADHHQLLTDLDGCPPGLQQPTDPRPAHSCLDYSTPEGATRQVQASGSYSVLCAFMGKQQGELLRQQRRHQGRPQQSSLTAWALQLVGAFDHALNTHAPTRKG
jgi:hypothetical protein